MKSVTSCAAALLLAATAIAAPKSLGSTLAEKQKALESLSKLLNRGQVTPFKPTKGPENRTDASTVYSSNWGGVVVDDTGITQVQATFTVPSVSLPSGDSSSSDWYGCAWVGIDGDDSCSSGLWQAGAYWLYNDGWSYFPFFEWYPGGVQAADLDISPGDSISVSVVSTSKTSGVYTFTNHASGQTVTGSLSNQPQLCQSTVEWIVEDNNAAGAVMPDFGSVTFNSAQYTANGNIKGVSGGNIFVVYDNNVDYTSTTITGANSLQVNYEN